MRAGQGRGGAGEGQGQGRAGGVGQPPRASCRRRRRALPVARCPSSILAEWRSSWVGSPRRTHARTATHTGRECGEATGIDSSTPTRARLYCSATGRHVEADEAAARVVRDVAVETLCDRPVHTDGQHAVSTRPAHGQHTASTRRRDSGQRAGGICHTPQQSPTSSGGVKHSRSRTIPGSKCSGKDDRGACRIRRTRSFMVGIPQTCVCCGAHAAHVGPRHVRAAKLTTPHKTDDPE